MTPPTAAAPELPDYAPAPRSSPGPAAFSVLESIRLDLGYRMDVHP